MKTKTLLILLAAFYFVAGCSTTETETIEISKNSTQSYLDSLTVALDKKGISLKLDTTEFNEQGELQKVSGQIRFSFICSGTFSTDSLDKIIIKGGFGEISINIYQKDKPAPQDL